jgi:hypothetical protein
MYSENVRNDQEFSPSSYKKNMALFLASIGIRIIPIMEPEITERKNGKGEVELIPPKDRGKLPYIKWKDGASSDPEIIESWFRLWPNMNYALLCGEVSGIFVLDVDGPEGLRSLAEIITTYCGGDTSVLNTLIQRTGRTDGGFHVIWKYPKGANLGPWTKKLPGLDARGNGSYIVGPGSTHHTGAVYYLEYDGAAL